MPKQLGDLRLFEVEDLAESLGLHERTVRQLLREGRLKGRKLGKRWYVTEAGLRAYFEDTDAQYQEKASDGSK